MPRLGVSALIRFARANSPFYRDLYASLPPDASLEALPIVLQDGFWEANTLQGNRVLTGPMKDGVVFKSGGTTGNPKFSVFSKAEWKVFCEVFGRGIATSAVTAGDRVVNLFYVGQLYGSFLFINKSLEDAPLGVLQLPVGGATDFDETMQIIRDFRVNVLAGVPTTILNLAEYIRARGGAEISEYPVQKILFGGEPMHEDQKSRLQEIFPGVRILSIGYASTDAGLLGYADSSCGAGEHRVFDGDMIMEILDEETRQPIHEMNREGLLVTTNLTRTLMPIIRYPAGDRGIWTEPAGSKDRKFRLLGRSEEAARIGLVKLYAQDVRDALHSFREKVGLIDFQLLIDHHDRLDGLTVRIASNLDPRSLERFSAEIVREIHRARPLYEEFVRDSKVHPITIAWVSPSGLETNHRTGKLRRVIDRRFLRGSAS